MNPENSAKSAVKPIKIAVIIFNNFLGTRKSVLRKSKNHSLQDFPKRDKYHPRSFVLSTERRPNVYINYTKLKIIL
jgi:hypothetical protein